MHTDRVRSQLDCVRKHRTWKSQIREIHECERGEITQRKVPKGYMALEPIFVSARRIKRHHHQGGPEDEALLDVGVSRRKCRQPEDESLLEVVLREGSCMGPSKMWPSWMCPSRQEDVALQVQQVELRWRGRPV